MRVCGGVLDAGEFRVDLEGLGDVLCPLSANIQAAIGVALKAVNEGAIRGAIAMSAAADSKGERL